jgi:hypothetical protein
MTSKASKIANAIFEDRYDGQR